MKERRGSSRRPGKPLVLLTKRLPLDPSDPWLTRLERLADIRLIRPPLDRSRRGPLLSRAVALLTFVTDLVDAELLAGAPRLKVVSNFAVGYDNIDADEARRRGIVVCNTPDVLTNATAELAIALLFAAARRFKEGMELIRRRRYRGWEPDLLLGRELAGARIGIVGLGRIGTAMARKARALGMDVVGCVDPEDRARERSRHGIPLLRFEALLRTSDFVSIHCPLNARTRHLFGPRAFGLMKTGAILVNTARGEIVDERAMLEALRRGRLGGAALDVFEGEPRLRRELRAHSKVLVLPHLGSATLSARRGMARLAIQGILDVLGGRTPRNRVS